MAHMAYTTNPHLPHVRMEAVRLVHKGWSKRKAARHLGYSHSAIVKWCERKPLDLRARVIPTLSSRPHRHPRQLSYDVVETIIRYRRKYRRCAEVIHHLLVKDGYSVSLSSVKRTLKRSGMTYPSKWKKWHQYPPRPKAERPGVLVEIDTIHDGPHLDRLYVYTLLDIFSRWAYALPSFRITTHQSLSFIKQAEVLAPFTLQTLQSDHGSEFSKWFTKRVIEKGISHRHSRIRTPSDNGHLERFNRTLQDECLSRFPRNLKRYQKEIPEYLEWYNTKRPHMALGMRSPIEVVPSY